MSYLEDLIRHIEELKQTLGQGKVGQSTKAYADQFEDNLEHAIPVLKPRPTVEDLLHLFGRANGLSNSALGMLSKPRALVVKPNEQDKPTDDINTLLFRLKK